MIFQFTPDIGQNQSFQPILDGNIYAAAITWNIFAQRWYLNLSDLNGNLIIYRAVSSSADPAAIANISWSQGIVTVVTEAPHFLGLGVVAELNISDNSPAGYNGIVDCNVTGPNTFTYALTADPGQQTQVGHFGSVVDLTDGAFVDSVLVYYDNSSTFVSIP